MLPAVQAYRNGYCHRDWQTHLTYYAGGCFHTCWSSRAGTPTVPIATHQGVVVQPLQRLGSALVQVPILIHRLHEQVFEVVQRLVQDNA